MISVIAVCPCCSYHLTVLCENCQTYAPTKPNVLIDLDTDFEGRLVAHSTLRLLNPECHLDSDWSAEPLPLQSARAVSLLYADSVHTSSSSLLLSAPTVAYCFPLLCAVVTSRKNSEHDELLLVKCLDILSTHAAKLRSDDPRSEVTQFCALYL